jgi:enamine deaminase RidA (YjgF/YER057c/UK114 family)
MSDTPSRAAPPAHAAPGGTRDVPLPAMTVREVAGRMEVSSGGPWEETVGYVRAVRTGPHVHVAGTTATGPDGAVVGAGDAYQQARYTFLKIQAALHLLGARMSDVVRTRMFVTDIGRWEEFGRAHGEFFAGGGARPAATMVEVAKLIDPAMLIEIEVDVYVVAQ